MNIPGGGTLFFFEKKHTKNEAKLLHAAEASPQSHAIATDYEICQNGLYFKSGDRVLFRVPHGSGTKDGYNPRIEGAYTLRSSRDGKEAGGREREERTRTWPGGHSFSACHAMPCHAIQGTAKGSHTLGNNLSFVSRFNIHCACAVVECQYRVAPRPRRRGRSSR